MTRFRKIIAALILLSLLVPLAAGLIGVDSPNYSKEPLSAFPEWTADRRFGEGFDRWWSDHFPFRSTLVTFYHKSLGAVTGISGSDQVMKGRNGWYFFVPTVKDYVKADIVCREDCEKIARSVEIQRRFAANNGCAFLICIAPNKASVYPENMPWWIRSVGGTRPLEMLKEAMPDACYLEDVLLNAKNTSAFALYHAEDTHWNRLGAYIAYREVLSRLGMDGKAIAPDSPVMKDTGWEGDLSNMLFPAIRSDSDQILFPGFEPVFRSKRLMRTSEDPSIETVSPKKEGVVLMFRDSFANAWIDLFSSTFHTVHYSRVVPYRYDLASELKADVVILEIVERNLSDLLHGTPELTAPEAFPVTERIHEKESLFCRVFCDVRKERAFYNFLPDDVAAAKAMTAVQLFDGRTWYEAFPVYDSHAGGEGAHHYGFSLYVPEASDWHRIRFRTAEGWFEAPLEATAEKAPKKDPPVEKD